MLAVARRLKALGKDVIELHDRRGIDIKFVDDRRIGAGGQAREDGIDLALHFLLGHVAIFFKDEDDVERRDALLGGGAQFVDAGNGVDGFFEHFGDAGFHFLDAGARAGGGDGDDGEIDVGEEVDAHVHVGENSQRHREEDQRRREDGTLDAQFGEGHDD